MDLSDPLDNYCERLDPGLLAEPVNLLTNLGFIAAGVAGVWMMRRHLTPEQRVGPLWLLVGLAFAIGVGSGLFHSFATVWAVLADTIPIGLYLVSYLVVLTRVLLGTSWRLAGASLVTLGALTLVSSVAVPAEAVNGSQLYFGAVAILFIAASMLWRTHPRPAGLYVVAGLVFAVSLVFRSVDLSVCEAWPVGTHFMWHLCNAVVIYATLRAAIMLRRARPG